MAEQFVLKALDLMKPQFYGYQLLRAGFTHSQERASGLHKLHHFHEVHALNPRPSFGYEDTRVEFHPGKRNTNAYEYSLFQWDWMWHNDYGLARELAWEYMSIEAIKELESNLPPQYGNYDLLDSLYITEMHL